MKYTKWTNDLSTQAKFLLEGYRNYALVSKQLNVPESALRNQNNRYWHIDCRKKWSKYADEILLQMYNDNISKKEIADLFDTTENAINIRLSQLKKKGR